MKKRTWKWFAVTAVVLASLGGLTVMFSSGEDRLEHEIPALFSVDSPDFARTVNMLLGPPLVGGNHLTVLTNGDEIFPAMLKAIAGAKRSINLETYIYWSGDVGTQFSEALSERARAGVKTHVLMDWVGAARMDQDLIDGMRKAGVKVEYYRPLRWYNVSRFNNRTHRKLLIVDGVVGFTGGVGIADVWQGNAQDKDHWRDSHFRVEGPVVAQLQATFLDNWIRTKAEVLYGEPYFPPIPATANGKLAQVFRSSAREGGDNVRLMYLLSMTSARKTIRMANAYFVPDALSIKTFIAARKRGVDVELLVPGPIMDQEVVTKASRASWGELLAAGIKIYQYQPTMMHCKILVVDGLWTSVGSTNFDNRSFRLNDEANLNVLDRQFAEENLAQFEIDKKNARLYTLEDWKGRRWTERFSDWVASWFTLQL